MAADVTDETLAGFVVPDAFPESTRCVEVFGADFAEESHGIGGELAVDLVEVDGALTEFNGFDRGEVVGAGALVVEGHLAVALEVADAIAGSRGVDGKLLVVSSDAVAVSVGVGEEAGLQDGVCGGLDAGDHVGGVVCGLLDLGKVVFCVFVKGEFADFAEGELLVGPNVGQVKDVDLLLLPEVFGFFGGHGLPCYGPGWIFATFDCFEEVFLGVIWGLCAGLFLCQKFGPLFGLHVHLSVHPFAFLVYKLQGVSGITVHEAVPIGNTTVTHKDHDLVNRLGVLGKVVPEHRGAGRTLARSSLTHFEAQRHTHQH